ncbi:hypothetical protein [Caballeronia ptereochthonis]|nr:hypothetical protein [Caballeronia ptereochthonis]
MQGTIAGVVEVEMEAVRKSLRDIFDTWLPPNHAMPTRISAFRHSRYKRGVRIEAELATGAVTICFFRHEGGGWHVFPPDPRRPALPFA